MSFLLKQAARAAPAVARGLRFAHKRPSFPINFTKSMLPQPITPEQAVQVVKANDNIFVHTAASTPTCLLEALVKRCEAEKALTNLKLFHLHIEGPAPFTRVPNQIRDNSLFMGANVRQAVKDGVADSIPCFLSEIPLFFRRGRIPLDVAFVTVSPFDNHGYASLGVSCDGSLAGVETAKHVIAVVNPTQPRTHGRSLIHISQIDALVCDSTPIYAHESHGELDEQSKAIGRHIAAIIPDGACLQLGIGDIPNAVLSQLKDHKHMGVHTELLSTGALPLIESGAIDNSRKKIMPGRSVVSFSVGSRKLYNFYDDNPMFYFDECSWVNDPAVVRQNPNQVACNSCIEVDLTGQVVSDSIGTRMYSGVGGQLDFIRGASLSEGGLPIIAFPSITGKGETRIVNTLKPGAGVVTTRAHVHYICTEYGIVDVWGKTNRERAKLLISISHPTARESLEKAAFSRFGPSIWPVPAPKSQ